MQRAGRREPRRRGLDEKTQGANAVCNPRPWSFSYSLPGTEAFWDQTPKKRPRPRPRKLSGPQEITTSDSGVCPHRSRCLTTISFPLRAQRPSAETPEHANEIDLVLAVHSSPASGRRDLRPLEVPPLPASCKSPTTFWAAGAIWVTFI